MPAIIWRVKKHEETGKYLRLGVPILFAVFLGACSGDGVEVGSQTELLRSDSPCNDLVRHSPVEVLAFGSNGLQTCDWSDSRETSFVERTACTEFGGSPENEIVTIYRRDNPESLELYIALTSDPGWAFHEFNPERFGFGQTETSVCDSAK